MGNSTKFLFIENRYFLLYSLKVIFKYFLGQFDYSFSFLLAIIAKSTTIAMLHALREPDLKQKYSTILNGSKMRMA